MFTESDRNMLESVFSFIDMMRRKACERGDFYSVAEHFRKRIDNFEHDMIVRTDEIKDSVEKVQGSLDEVIESNIGCFEKAIMDITHKERIELERTIRPDLDCIKRKIGASTDVKGEGDDDEKKKEIRLDLFEHYREMDRILTRVEDIESMMFGVQDSVKRMHEAFDMIFPLLVKRCGKCGGDDDAEDGDGRSPSLSAIIDTSIDVCRLEERMESIKGKLDSFMRMFREGVADAVDETSDKPKRSPGRRRKDA